MWKKTETEQNEVPRQTFKDIKTQPMGEKAVIGPSLIVKGDVSGNEDLTIQGQVEGKVLLKQNSVTVGKNGRVKADLYARSLVVEGAVQGNLYGEEKIVVRQTGDVKGNLSAPRVILEDGAKFKGSIDMEGTPSPKSQKSSGDTAKTQAQSAISGKGGASSSASGSSGQPGLGIKISQPSSSK